MPAHKDVTIADGIHGVLAGSFANDAAREAGTLLDPSVPGGTRSLSNTDVGKIFQQLDNGVWYGLFSVAPLNFWVIGSGSTSVFSHGDLPGGSLHAVATTSTHGFYSSTDKVANDDHRANTSNPHSVTAAQAGAIATAVAMGVTGTPTTGQVLTATGANAATWQTPGTGGVSGARIVASGAGLTGGGDLTADRTLAVGANADGSIVVNADDIQVGILATDAQHGVRGGGTQHAVATSSVAGFMSAADKVKLDGLGSGLALSSTLPAAVGTAAIGVGTTAARADHIHAHGNQGGGSEHALVVPAGAAGFISGADKTKLDGIATGATAVSFAGSTPATVSAAAGAAGVGAFASRHDHSHQVSVGSPVAVGTANAAGSADTLSRSDHVHALAAATTSVQGAMSAADKIKLDGIAAGATNTPLSSTLPSAVGTAAIGVGTTAARHDHIHAHGDQAGGTLHANATTSVAGFMSAADKLKLDGITGGGVGLSDSTPSPIGTAAAGVATAASRYDHVHAHGDQAGGTLHAAVTTSVNGFMSAADKLKLDGIASGATALALSSTLPSPIGTAAIGAGTTAARHDHVHAHGDQGGGTEHTAATTSVNGFMSSTDKVKLDGIQAGATGTLFGDVAPGPGIGIDGNYYVRTDTREVFIKASGAWSVFKVILHGDQAGGSLHALATTSIAGFMSAADKAKLDGLASGSTNTPLTTSMPLAVGTAAVGVATSAARADHIHAHGDQAGGTQHTVATASVAGFMSAGDKSKIDSIQAWANRLEISASAPPGGWGGNADDEWLQLGDGTVSRWNGSAWIDLGRVMGAWASTPSDVTSAGVAGSSPLYARGDHQHAHGSQAGGTAHSVVTTSIAGFMSAADKVKLDGIATGATALALSSTTPAVLDATAGHQGAGITAARADHRHQISVAAPVSVGAANAVGTSESMSRADHVHAHGAQAGGSQHTVVTTSVDGFMSSSDKVKLNGIQAQASRVVFDLGAPPGSWSGATGDTRVSLSDGGVYEWSGSAFVWRGDIVARSNTAAQALGTAGPGVSSEVSRADHVHAHGNLTGGSMHSAATSSVAGFMSATDKDWVDYRRRVVRLTSVSGSLTLTKATHGFYVELSISGNLTLPVPTGYAAGDLIFLRISNASPGGYTVSFTGSWANLARYSDAGNASNADCNLILSLNANANQFGIDHCTPWVVVNAAKNQVFTPADVAAASASGSSAYPARADHVHGHGNQAGGSLHALATTGTAGFMSNTDKAKLDGISAGATAVVISSAVPPAIGTASSLGAQTRYAREDHSHAHGNLAGGSLHAVATTSVAGFMSAADKAKLDGIGGVPAMRTVPNAEATASLTLEGGAALPSWVCNGSGWVTTASADLAGTVFYPLNSYLKDGTSFTDVFAYVVAAGSGANRMQMRVYKSTITGTTTQLGASTNNVASGAPQLLTVSFTETVDLQNNYYASITQLLTGSGDSIASVRVNNP